MIVLVKDGLERSVIQDVKHLWISDSGNSCDIDADACHFTIDEGSTVQCFTDAGVPIGDVFVARTADPT